MAINFELISKLKFQDAIKINGRILYRAQEYPDFSTKSNTIIYLFYDTWNKKNILPKPNYQVKLYIKVESIKKADGWIKNRIAEYKKGEIQNLRTNKVEAIKTVENTA